MGGPVCHDHGRQNYLIERAADVMLKEKRNHHPKRISDMVDFIVGRVLDSMGIENDLAARWGI
jgi:3-polyprenyl-4-hydroxybenzoate decarboxylase